MTDYRNNELLAMGLEAEVLSIPAWVRSTPEVYLERREKFKYSLQKTLEEHEDIRTEKELFTYAPGLSKDIFFKYQFHRDIDIMAEIDRRKGKVCRQLLSKMIDSEDHRDRKFAYILLTSKEERDLFQASKEEDPNRINKNVNINLTSEDLIKYNMKLSEILRPNKDNE